MRQLRLAAALIWLGAAGCGSIQDLLLGPLAASCPTMSELTVENLITVVEDLEQTGMSRMNALNFASDNCVENSITGDSAEALEESCDACANSVLLVTYDSF